MIEKFYVSVIYSWATVNLNSNFKPSIPHSLKSSFRFFLLHFLRAHMINIYFYIFIWLCVWKFCFHEKPLKLHLGWIMMEVDLPTWGINGERISYWGYCDWRGSGIPVVWNYFINWNLQIHSFKLYIKLFIFLSDYVESRMKWEGLKYFNFRHTFWLIAFILFVWVETF